MGLSLQDSTISRSFFCNVFQHDELFRPAVERKQAELLVIVLSARLVVVVVQVVAMIQQSPD